VFLTGRSSEQPTVVPCPDGGCPAASGWDARAVGLVDNIRTAISWAREADDNMPKWARITSVDRRVGPMTRIGLVVHYGVEPPYEASTLVWVPRGVEPQVGQDVAIGISTGDDVTHYEILWHQHPRYGNPSFLHPAERQARAAAERQRPERR
jgi:hypothetical protein